MCINSLEVSKGAPKENFLSSIHRSQVVENQTEVLIIGVADLKWKFKFQSQKLLVVKVWALVGKECNPVTLDGDMQGEPTEVENFKSSDSQGFISPEEVVSPLSAENLLS